MSTDNGVPNPTAYEFIYTGDVNAKSRIRRHAMNEFRRQRRNGVLSQNKKALDLQNIIQRDTEDESPRNEKSCGALVPLRPKQTTSKADHEQALILKSKEQRAGLRRQYATITWEGGRKIFMETIGLTFRSSPTDLLSASRRDPFESYPVKNLGKEGHEVLDYFNRDMPFQEFDIEEKACLNPPRDLAFMGSLDCPAAFHALLATGAIHLSSIRHVKASFIAYHLAESLRLLQEGMKKGTDPVNIKSLIGAAAALTSAEDFKGDSKSCRIHLMGLKQMVMTIGGLQKLNEHRRMQMLVVFIAASCNATYLPQCTTFGRIEAVEQEIQSHITQFKDFFRSLKKAASQINTGVKIAGSFKGVAGSFVHSRPIQHFLLKKDGPLHQLLAPSEEDCRRGGGGLGYLGTHRLACLFYLCAVLLDLRTEDGSSDTIASEQYLQQTHGMVLKHELDRRPNVRLFMFILIRGPDIEGKAKLRLQSADRSWALVRLMQVTKCLTWETAMRVGLTLLNFLMMMDEPGKTRMGRPLDLDRADLLIIENEVRNKLSEMG